MNPFSEFRIRTSRRNDGAHVVGYVVFYSDLPACLANKIHHR